MAKTAMERLKLKSLADAILALREGRHEKDELIANLAAIQPEIIAYLKEVDPANNGVIYAEEDPLDEGKKAAFRQENKAPEEWDVDAIMEWLHTKAGKRFWMKVTSRVFDQGKWEAAITAGEIPALRASKFKVTGATPTPFVRFGKPKKNSKEV